ncbi:MAG: acyl-CoA dehydrogenase [Pseudonocardia sp. SCN 72-86]|nr:MAG: acyl-CoA dehydrogenase [Pseudonocardia sp. SCN 72-86]
MAFEPTALSDREKSLQAEVREFLAAELPPGTYERGLGMGGGKDRGFSKKLAERGWLGMALPARYGGGDRSATDRFLVVEELLRWGAPLSHHWVADRQSGPTINAFGTEEQKRRFLPAIAKGEISFSIGMSEPDSGSDLASVSTKAVRADGGWIVTGRKLWTSGARENDWMIMLCRTSVEEDRHAGLTQMLVDLRSPELTINPITFIDGTSGFNEVVIEELFVPDDLVLGRVGNGWKQIGSELAYERGGPDRWLSPFGVVEELVRSGIGDHESELSRTVGGLAARWWALRQLSLSVARMVDAGRSPAVEAALVKSIGTRFEQEVVDVLADLLDAARRGEAGPRFEQLFSSAVVTSAGWTLRGGTNEVLRSVVAKGL